MWKNFCKMSEEPKTIEEIAAEAAAAELESARVFFDRSAEWETDLNRIVLLLDKLREEFGPIMIGRVAYEAHLGGVKSVYGVHRPSQAHICGIVRVDGESVTLIRRDPEDGLGYKEVFDARTASKAEVWKWIREQTVCPDSPETLVEILEYTAKLGEK